MAFPPPPPKNKVRIIEASTVRGFTLAETVEEVGVSIFRFSKIIKNLVPTLEGQKQFRTTDFFNETFKRPFHRPGDSRYSQTLSELSFTS